MRKTGVIRKLDELGRLVIPMELRKSLDIKERDGLEIFMEGNYIILQKYENSCVFCEDTSNLTKLSEKYICKDCVNTIKESF